MGNTQGSVQEGWLARLPEERRAMFEDISREWEAAYGMLSVALNEAMAERAEGRWCRRGGSAPWPGNWRRGWCRS